ncbi:thymidylate kinase [Ascosphaera apis ARSEF 7405]|uniref:Thymidylate kinase n=1 Tax=Ascosphaera apis ARSEF 7405 TaxID=392613 RepID=A0A162I9H9_9EURO|nr:thymidylate kinase [Ascosphaera apis ARSEF 7405]
MTLNSESSSPSRGALLVVEGLDRAGKSTQCAILTKVLQEKGHKVKYIRFPDRTTEIGKLISSYLRGDFQLDDQSIHLLFSANRWQAAAQMEEDIANGITLIVDRYSYSGAVYSAAKDNASLSLDWAWSPEIGLPKPDLWIYMDISLEEAARRGGYGQERYENEKLQSRARVLFKKLVELEDNGDVYVINAGQTQEEVTKELLGPMLKTIEGLDKIGPLRKLGQWPKLPHTRV